MIIVHGVDSQVFEGGFCQWDNSFHGGYGVPFTDDKGGGNNQFPVGWFIVFKIQGRRQQDEMAYFLRMVEAIVGCHQTAEA